MYYYFIKDQMSKYAEGPRESIFDRARFTYRSRAGL